MINNSLENTQLAEKVNSLEMDNTLIKSQLAASDQIATQIATRYQTPTR
jgi:hypothetical protein